MLKLEGRIDLPEATCWFDDTGQPDNHNLPICYVLPAQPTMRVERVDGRDKAVFKYVSYRTPKPMPNGDIAAALVFMDVQLALSPAQEQSVRARVAQVLTERRGPGAPPVDPAQLTLARPQTTKAEVEVEILAASGQLVQRVNQAGVPSNYGNYVVAASAELSQLGAPVFESVMKSQGAGGVRVVYKLQFAAKVPPVVAWGVWSASKFYSFVHEVEIDERCLWRNDEFSERLSEVFANSESRQIEVDPGGQANEAVRKVIDNLRDAVTSQLDEAVKRNLLEAIPPESRDLSQLRKEDFEKIRREVTVNKRSDVRVEFRENQVVTVPVAPQANMQSLTSQGFNWDEYAIEADTDHPFFRQLNLTIQVNADFENLPIFSVDVSIDYPPERNRGGIKTFTFRKADDVGKYSAFTDGNPRDFKYQYVVNYEGESRVFRSGWLDHSGDLLTIGVDDLGLWNLEVQPSGIDFETVSRVLVTLEHPEVAPGVPRIAQFEIKEDTGTLKVQEVLLAPPRPFHASLKYLMRDGRQFVRALPDQEGSLLTVDDPFTATRTVVFRARGDLQNAIENIAVGARYHDAANNWIQTKNVTLSKDNPFLEWSFPVIDELNGTVTYTASTVFADGDVVEEAEREATTTTVFVGPETGRLEVTINPDLIDFSKVKLASVTLRYIDEPNRINETESFTFRPGGGPQTWVLPLRDEARNGYEWTAKFFMVDGSRKESSSGGLVTDEDLFIELPA